MAPPVYTTDAVNKQYVDDNAGISQSDADARYYSSSLPLNGILAPNGNVSLNNNKITNLQDATSGGDALNL